MKSKSPGVGTSTLEITNISKHGCWILVDEEELFLAFKEFPWFRDAPLSAILAVEQLSPGSLYWPLLDVDLTLESIRYPDRYPLISKIRTQPAVPTDAA